MGATPKNKVGSPNLFKGAIILVIAGATLIVLLCQLVLFHSFSSNVELPTKPHDFHDSLVEHGPEREHVRISASNIDFCKQAGRELATTAADGTAMLEPTVRTDVDNTVGQKMSLVVVHRAYDDAAWTSRFRQVADVDVRMVANFEDELQEFIQYIVDNYDDLNPLVGFLHGPLDDWHWMPGGSLARWSSTIVGEGVEPPKRSRLTVDELVQAFKYINSDYDRFKATFPSLFLGLHDISPERCDKEEVERLRVYLRCTWRSEPWLYRLREKYGWTDETLTHKPATCRTTGNSIVHRDLIWKHNKEYWRSFLHTAETLSQEVQWTWKRHVETHKVLKGLSLWSLIMTTSLEDDFGWYGNDTFRPPGGFHAGKKIALDDHNRDTHLSPLPRAPEPPYQKIVLTHMLRSGGTWAKEVMNLGMYTCGQKSQGQFNRDCMGELRLDRNCTCINHVGEAELNKWQFHLHFHKNLDAAFPGYRIFILREPCSYYVGVWRFQAQYARLTHPHIMQWKCLFGDAPDTEFFPRSMRGENAVPKFPQHAVAFRKWLKAMHHGNTMGTYSYRFWATQRFKDWNWSIPELHFKQEADDGQRSMCARMLDRSETRQIKDQFHDIDTLFGHAQCWVSFSNMPQDLSFCLRQFEAIHPGHFNLEYITQVEQQPRHVPSWPCEEMYDDESRKLVELMDGVVFKRFGFQCCKSHGFHERHHDH